MDLQSNIVDPASYAEGLKMPFDGEDKIDPGQLKVFAFHSPSQLIVTHTKEFQAVCPFSGLPDVAEVTVGYFPWGKFALELKSLKYYLMSFRTVGIYQEAATERIYKDLLKALRMPGQAGLIVCTKYNVRGGFYTLSTSGYIDRFPDYFLNMLAL